MDTWSINFLSPYDISPQQKLRKKQTNANSMKHVQLFSWLDEREAELGAAYFGLNFCSALFPDEWF